MSWSEAEWVANTEAIDRIYLELLGRRLDPNGLGSRVGYHMREQGRSLDWFRELLAWGELPPLPTPIADAWDDGRWPILIAGRDEAGQQADIDRAVATHRNTMLVLITNPDTGNPPIFLRSSRFANAPRIHLGPEIAKALLAGQRIQARGLAVHYVLWSDEAERAFGDGRRRVKEFGAALPIGSDVWAIETEEYWSDGELDDVGTSLAQRHRVWCHYRPRVLEPAPPWAHGLMLQLEPNDDLLTWLRRARGVWGTRPILLAEIQGEGALMRWHKFQDWLRLGGAGGLHVGAR